MKKLFEVYFHISIQSKKQYKTNIQKDKYQNGNVGSRFM